MAEKREKERTPFDALVKRLSDQFGPELLTYLGELKGVLSVESVGGEVEVMHRLSDRMWRVTQKIESKTKEYLMHVEFESKYEPYMERRLGTYGWGVYEKEKLPVRHLVWYVGEGQPTDWPENEWSRSCQGEMKIGEEVLAWVSWREIWLPGGHEAEGFLESAPSYLLPFVVFMSGMKKDLIPKLQNAILTKESKENRQQDLLAMSVFFLSRKFSFETIKECFDMESLASHELAEYFIEKGVERGREEGRQKGLSEAREKEALKMQATLISLLNQKVRNLPSSLVEQIQKCSDPDRLREFLLQIAVLQEEDAVLEQLKQL